MHNVPNLDNMTRDELVYFRDKHWKGRHADKLFPTKPRGFTTATRELARYADYKQTAIGYLESGHITYAIHYEGMADGVYLRLPRFAIWLGDTSRLTRS